MPDAVSPIIASRLNPSNPAPVDWVLESSGPREVVVCSAVLNVISSALGLVQASIEHIAYLLLVYIYLSEKSISS